MVQGHHEYIRPINSSYGIYFDPIGNLKTHISYLDIVTPFDSSYIEPYIGNSNSVLGTIRFLCNKIQIEVSNDLECHNVLEPLTIRYNDIVSEYSSISHLINKRFKRAWIGGIGTLSKTNFGTLNEDDAVKYNDTLYAILYIQ